ncbi:hypothetical protein [uncultured Bacteroides sp.]|uniref:hypothetical protein n=1 Tax=uncultured Bacteroides sp. TaxID=162156 RepID=UPI00263052AF|nr:hypothetical protein [uncultured Bacteroides sp.]
MEIIDIIGKQANELLKNKLVIESLDKLKTDEEKQRWLAVASIYALCKANR